MKKIQNLTMAKVFAAALLAALLSVSVASAPSPIFQGKFSLPYEVRWGKAMLPAGEYWLRVDYVGPATIVTVQQAESGKTVAMVLSSSAEGDKNTKDGSALLIASRGGQRIVHSLKLAELGEVFIYDPALARGRGTIEEARKTQSVRVLAAR